MLSNYIAIYEWLAYGELRNNIGHSGLYCLHGISGLVTLVWHFATPRDAIYMVSNTIDMWSFPSYSTISNYVDGGINSVFGWKSVIGMDWWITTLLSIWKVIGLVKWHGDIMVTWGMVMIVVVCYFCMETTC
ncbi:MAG: hypothetical protein IJ880_01995, partial [Bacilli bacterium]|nr:hypothetical protein [Bacilli bacterium]